MAERRRYKIAKTEDFEAGTRIRVEIGKRKIAVFNVDGNFYAIADRCPHQFAPLSRGRLQGTVICNAETNWKTEWAHEGMVVVCPGHGMEFDIRTGDAFGHDLQMATYDVAVEGDEVILFI